MGIKILLDINFNLSLCTSLHVCVHTHRYIMGKLVKRDVVESQSVKTPKMRCLDRASMENVGVMQR